MADLHAMYDEAERLKDEDKYPEAITKYLEILNADESFALAHMALAVAYSKVGEHDKAIRHAERVCRLEPNDPFSYTAMSVTYQRAFAGTRNAEYIHMAEAAMAKAHALQARAW
jgi:tetratricopeptide (TPR) repeat protein